MRAGMALATLVLAIGQTGQLPRFRTSTSIVRLDVSVMDAHGAVRGLRETDFVVTDGGSRPAVRAEEVADAPLDIVLVVQPIPSVAYTSAEQAARMAQALPALLDPVEARDRLSVLVASAPPTRLRPLESGRPALDMTAFSRGASAAPWDGISAGLGEFDESDRRRVLIAVTNGADARSTVSFDLLADRATRLGPAFVLVGAPVMIREHLTVVPEIGMISLSDAQAQTSLSGGVLPKTLELLAHRTGGVVVNLANGEATQLIADLFAWLRARYVISYEPPPGKGWHPVSVKVNRRDAKVSVREGYFVD